MKLLIVLLAAVSVAVAAPGYVPGAYGAYGVLPQPVQDTPEVAAAKVAHFAAHAQARAATGYAAPAYAYAGPAAYAYGAPGAGFAYSAATVHPGYGAYGAYGLGYHGYNGAPVVLTPQGVPVDTPEVQAARAANAAAHVAAKQQHLYG